MIFILLKDGAIRLVFENDEVSSHEEHNSLIEEINDEYIDCQRIYEPTSEQKKRGYRALRTNEQKEIEEELLDFDREQNGILKTEMYFDGDY